MNKDYTLLFHTQGCEVKYKPKRSRDKLKNVPINATNRIKKYYNVKN